MTRTGRWYLVSQIVQQARATDPSHPTAEPPLARCLARFGSRRHPTTISPRQPRTGQSGRTKLTAQAHR
jgi:hypothetical protein